MQPPMFSTDINPWLKVDDNMLEAVSRFHFDPRSLQSVIFQSLEYFGSNIKGGATV